MKTSPLFNLDWRDAGKALIVATLTPVIPIVQQSIEAGSLTFNWKAIGVAAAGGFVAYLIKNFFTPEKVVMKPNGNDQAG